MTRMLARHNEDVCNVFRAANTLASHTHLCGSSSIRYLTKLKCRNPFYVCAGYAADLRCGLAKKDLISAIFPALDSCKWHPPRTLCCHTDTSPSVGCLLADVELEEIDKYSALVFTPAVGDSPHAEGNRQAVAGLGASLASTRSMLKVIIPDFDQVCDLWSYRSSFAYAALLCCCTPLCLVKCRSKTYVTRLMNTCGKSSA